MKDQSWIQFKNSCMTYLSTLSVNSLRSYAREVGVAKPTTKKKQQLIDEILGIFAGDIQPIPRATLGAPVKDSGVDVGAIKKEVERIHLQCYSQASGISVDELKKNLMLGAEQKYPEGNSTFDFKKELENLRNSGGNVFRWADPDAKQHDIRKILEKEIYRGQMETLGNVQLLLPLDCVDSEQKIILPMDLIRENDLRDGDIVSCYAKSTHNALVATEILTVNDRAKDDLVRSCFERAEVCYSTEKITLYSEKSASTAMKYLQWLVPLGKGQRGFVVSPPKAGKTSLLYDMAKAAVENNPYLTVMVLLVDQPPESVGAFKKIISRENLVYTTYEDDPERQTFTANFLLKRAKSLAECGRDVLLLVDSLNALAYAFNDTTSSVGGKILINGLESKTLQFMKKYFGTARCLENGGSVTIFGTLGVQTGNPTDDLIAAELSRISNLEITLSARMAFRRIYPAVDFSLSQAKQLEMLFTKEEQALERTLRSRFVNEENSVALHDILHALDTYEDFVKNVTKK